MQSIASSLAGNLIATLALVLALAQPQTLAQTSAQPAPSPQLQTPPTDPSLDGQITQTGKTYTLRVTTREVMVEVVALDRSNRPVTDMKSSDFQIFEVGRRSQKSSQAITAFQVIDPALESDQADPSSADSRITLGGGCAMRTTFHYRIAFHASSEGWTSGFHEVFIATGRPGVHLSFHRRYYVGVTEPPASPPPQNEKQANEILRQAACFHSPTPSSISIAARSIQTALTDPLRFSITVKPDSLAFISLTDETQRVQLDYGICTFDATGKVLRYVHTSAERVFSPEEYEQVRAHGFPNLLDFTRTGDPALARFVVRDRETGNLGSIQVLVAPPAPTEIPKQLKAGLKLAEEHRAERGTVEPRPPKTNWPHTASGTFGSIIPAPNSMCGDVYELPEGMRTLSGFEDMDTVGALYTYYLDLPYQFLDARLPGVASRSEWFSVDYHGEFWIADPGQYAFMLTSDDGAQLYIDDKRIIDEGGGHGPITAGGHVTLAAGRHTIHLPYYQGPQHLALTLSVQPPHQNLRVFDLRDFPPPPGYHVTSRILPGFEVVPPQTDRPPQP
jgi:hypothetical protein